ncbi:MAG: nitrate ABC transporter permease [Rhodocyclaceae bacterium]|nr:nitrate ABC transporter permease [Rhodocyclaceae bacterium]MCA3076064.1 nitrate ABC transporter permease [Rhodocyclaceae bacterium]MCA3089113.1 nitrate ABC transporter permease [Rhodocyclaceae bacterium]MCA3099801.1 nitrate ABC transporter permease [Rhodocyclaceae bacterium]MCA3100427.1 nitrate ABC transporter permease [Rhodocyclaceae bacterium]
MFNSVSRSQGFRAGILSACILALVLVLWHLATAPVAAPQYADPEYARLMGGKGQTSSGLPSLPQMGTAIWKHLSNPFYDNGPNDKGVGLQVGYSIGRVLLGFLLAAAVAIPLGFVIGMSPLLFRALNPFIQVLKPISPLAWMPLALYTIKDSTISSIFVIFICSIWPMLINTAHGVASVRRDWLNVARTLEVGRVRTALRVVLPAAAPTILTGMRISMGIAWLVIVAAEMLVGGTGIGYFVWNEWNNLSLTNVIFAILMIGVVGMLLDLVFGLLTRLVSYQE